MEMEMVKNTSFPTGKQKCKACGSKLIRLSLYVGGRGYTPYEACPVGLKLCLPHTHTYRRVREGLQAMDRNDREAMLSLIRDAQQQFRMEEIRFRMSKNLPTHFSDETMKVVREIMEANKL